ncbi:hypothetical protein OF381_10565 [Mannheimia haemolytica]
MRFIKTVRIDGKEVELVNEKIVKELNNSGRGFITVKADFDTVGKAVEIDVGEYDHYFAFFSGFVERENSESNGYKRLFIRENTAIFERTLNYSQRHVTVADVCEWVSNKTGLEFKYGDASYSNKPCPHFASYGTGYQLLNNIGKVFGIENYIWKQFADGSVYVGAWADSSHSEEEWEIDVKDSNAQSSGLLQIPINADIDTGAKVNGKRVQKLTLEGDFMTIEWQDLKENGTLKQQTPERRAVEKAFPELAGGYHLSKFGRVVGVSDPSSGGEISDPFRPKYAVEVQLLDEQGNEDESLPILSSVQIPVVGSSSQGGDFSFPEVGAKVEIGFVNGQANQPVIRNVFAEGKTVPPVGIGERLRQQRPEVFERVDSAGNMIRQTDQGINEQSLSRAITTDSETKQLGQQIKEIEGNQQTTVGGNKTTHVLGDVQEVAVGNKVQGVGGDFQQRISGVASLVAKGKNEQKGETVWTGSESVNGWAILEELLSIVAEMGKTLAEHTHPGTGISPQAPTFRGQANQATAAKDKLSPIVA